MVSVSEILPVNVGQASLGELQVISVFEILRESICETQWIKHSAFNDSQTQCLENMGQTSLGDLQGASVLEILPGSDREKA